MCCLNLYIWKFSSIVENNESFNLIRQAFVISLLRPCIDLYFDFNYKTDAVSYMPMKEPISENVNFFNELQLRIKIILIKTRDFYEFVARQAD